jgi:hypothetical protein
MSFDPSVYLDAEVRESNTTQFIPVPEGEYTAVLTGTPEIRQWTSRKDPSKSGLVLDLTWQIDDATVAAELGRDNVTCRQSVMLDLNSAGGIDTSKGRNVNLGRLREAVGLNEPGKPFAFRMLSGQVARVRVAHRTDGEQIFAEVKAVTKL